MFIKRNKTALAGKGYQSVLPVQGRREQAKRAPGRPAAGAPPPKTGLLEVRPVFSRKEGRTRGHALVCMLALKLARELERRLSPLGLTVQDGLERLAAVRLVRLGDDDLNLWRLPTSYPKAQSEVLEALPKFKAPLLSLGKTNKRRLKRTRKPLT